MRLAELTDDDQTTLDKARRSTDYVREQRRLQAADLLDHGHEAPEIAAMVGGSAP